MNRRRRKPAPPYHRASVEVRGRRLQQLKRLAKALGYDVNPGECWLANLANAGLQELYGVWWEMEQKVKQQLAKPAKAPKPRPIDLLLARLKDPATAEQTAHDMLVWMGVRKPVLKMVKAG